VTGMLFVAAIALAQASGISIDAAGVSAEAKAAVEKAITEMGCSLDVSHARGRVIVSIPWCARHAPTPL
jgi:hypothetical protein